MANVCALAAAYDDDEESFWRPQIHCTDLEGQDVSLHFFLYFEANVSFVRPHHHHNHPHHRIRVFLLAIASLVNYVVALLFLFLNIIHVCHTKQHYMYSFLSLFCLSYRSVICINLAMQQLWLFLVYDLHLKERKKKLENSPT